jgi:isopropylmalate/homocitrate/citramalate synthase
MESSVPWYKPGKWLVNPAYWDEEALAARAGMPESIRFIDCTLSEGDDCVGHQLNWNTRLGLMEQLDAVGVGEITLPSHTRFDEEADLVKAYRRLGLKTPLVAKGPGVVPPLRGDWRSKIDHHIDLGADAISPIFRWPIAETLSGFTGDLSKEEILSAIEESVAYMKSQRVRVISWIVDAMRTPPDIAAEFFGALARAGSDGVYVVDSRGNSTPLATRVFIRKVKAAIGECDLYVQHHNDMGVATANAMAAVEAGANWIDAAVLGIGDRGGCVSLEEAAALFEMYGIRTGIRLEKLYELGLYTQKAFGATLSSWKPLIGESWNKEEGAGHLDGSESAEATIALNPAVIGRAFEGVIGVKLLFGRERSSSWDHDPVFLRHLMADWGMEAEEGQFEVILHRARAAVATSHGRNYITVDEFRSICEGVLGC